MDDIDIALAAAVRSADRALQGPITAAPATDHHTVEALLASAKRFDARSDNFARGKGSICRDLAEKLARYGAFASERQADFARKLIEWSQPRAQAEAPAALYHPHIAHLLCTFSRGFRCGELKISLGKKGCYWVTIGGTLVGVHEAQNTKLFAGKIRAAGLDVADVAARLAAVEADPLAALRASGRETGICGCCGLPLVDPVSVARGIGPICAARLGGF